MSFLCEKVFDMIQFALQIKWVFYMKEEEFCDAKRNGFLIWKGFLSEIFCYVKGMNFHIWRVFSCELVFFMKRKSFLCEKGFPMWTIIYYPFKLYVPMQNWAKCSNAKMRHIGEGLKEHPMWRGEGLKERP